MFQSCTNFFPNRVAFPASVSRHLSLSLWDLDALKILDSDSFRITYVSLNLIIYSLYDLFALWMQHIHSKP